MLYVFCVHKTCARIEHNDAPRLVNETNMFMHMTGEVFLNEKSFHPPVACSLYVVHAHVRTFYIVATVVPAKDIRTPHITPRSGLVLHRHISATREQCRRRLRCDSNLWCVPFRCKCFAETLRIETLKVEFLLRKLFCPGKSTGSNQQLMKRTQRAHSHDALGALTERRLYEFGVFGC